MSYLEQILEIPSAKVKRNLGFEHIICYHSFRIKKLLETTLPDFRFTYFKKTEDGIALDDDANLEFGDHEFGFKMWQDLNQSKILIDDLKNATKLIISKDEVVGYILVERLYACYSTFKRIYDSALTTMFLDLGIKNVNGFVEYLFGFERVEINNVERRISMMLTTHEQYFSDTEFKNFIDYQYGYQL